MPDGVDAGALLAIGGSTALAGAFIASLTQLVKGVLPVTWQTGRGILIVVYALSALLALGATLAIPPDAKPDVVALVLGAVLFWQGVVQAAIGANQLARKGEAIVRGTTDPTGQDPPSG